MGFCSSPYVCDGLFVFVVCGPYCYFISFGPDVNDGSTHVVAVVIKRLAHETQKLQEQQSSFPKGLVMVQQFFTF